MNEIWVEYVAENASSSGEMAESLVSFVARPAVAIEHLVRAPLWLLGIERQTAPASPQRVWLATGHTDMRRGMNSPALLVQEAFRRDPHGGDLYVFRGKSGMLIKILSYGPAWGAPRSAPKWIRAYLSDPNKLA
jgi:hypothetical protein